MEWWQVVFSLLLSSNVIIELIKAISAWKLKNRERREKLEDRAMDRNDKTQSLEERFDQFCKDQKAENYEIRHRLAGIETAMGKMSDDRDADRYIDLRKEGLQYIKAGHVDAEDRLAFVERYDRYVKSSKRNDLDNIVSEVKKLPTKI